jgi:hypothetical protein
MSSWGFTNDFNSLLGFLGLGLGFSFLRFLGLGLGFGLNKINLAYVCMSRVLHKGEYMVKKFTLIMYFSMHNLGFPRKEQ